MFKGLGMEPFSFSFSNGVVTGPNYSFDLKGPLGQATPAAIDFYRSNPGQLVSYIHDDWNKKFNPQCIISGGNLYLGVEWNVACLQAAGTPNLLSAATSGIQSAVAAWGTAYLGAPTGGGGGTNPPTTTQCATAGKKPLVGQACCTGLARDSLGFCVASANSPLPIPDACVGTWVCSIPDMWIYGGLGVLAFLLMKR
jgi:hypothetical protein